MNLPALRAESISAFCAGESSRNRAIFSTSSGGIDRQIHHSIMLSMGSGGARQIVDVLRRQPEPGAQLCATFL